MTKNELIDFNALLAKIYELTAERDRLLSAIDPSIDGLEAEIDELEDERDALEDERDALLSAIDDIVTAAALPGDHCELDDAIKAAGKLLPRPRVEIGTAATCRTGVTDSAFTQERNNDE